MAGKKTAKEIMDEWEASLRQGAKEAVAPAKVALQDAGIVDKDLGYYQDKAGNLLDQAGNIIKTAAPQVAQQAQGALQDAQGAAGDIYAKAQAAAPGLMQDARNAVASAPSAYDEAMMGADMQPTPETAAYYQQMQQQANVPMAQKAGQAVGQAGQAVGGLLSGAKDMASQFMQGMNGNPDQELMQKLQSLTPEQKAALLQQLGGQ